MKLLELTLQNFQCLSGITKIQFSKDPSRNISLIVSQDPEEGQALVDVLEWVFLFNPIYTERWRISEEKVTHIDQLHCRIRRSCGDDPTTVSLKLTDDGHEYCLIRKVSKEIGSGENILDSRFPNDHSTFCIVKDGVALHHDEMHNEIYRMVGTRLCGNVYWDELKYVQKFKDKRFIEIFDPVLRGGSFPLVVWQSGFSSNRAKFETWQSVLKLPNLQVLLFTTHSDLQEGDKDAYWLSHIKSNIGLLCLFFQNGSSKSTTVHWGENKFPESDWLNQALGCGQGFYQASNT